MPQLALFFVGLHTLRVPTKMLRLPLVFKVQPVFRALLGYRHNCASQTAKMTLCSEPA